MDKIEYITDWIKDYAEQGSIKTLIIGISGGVDSAVVSTLCARTGLPTVAVTMPIRQIAEQNALSMRHGRWLQDRFKNVQWEYHDLTNTFDQFCINMAAGKGFKDGQNALALANSRSRLRMTALYFLAGKHNGIVVGTGNKVEDFGVGFYTKYGDGGVDISPIADLMKTDVWNMARQLDILQEIIDAPPTDGLWDDGRKDQDQLNGLTYSEIEQIMLGNITDQDKIERYNEFNLKNKHKMQPIPVCILPK